jgi:cephalosporin-C deacetylase-like acetyl esterase
MMKNFLRSCLFAGALLFACHPTDAGPLDGTQPLEWAGDLAAKMVEGIHTFLDRETAASVERRARHWHRDFSSPEAYEKSVEPNRQHLREILGVIDERTILTSGVPRFKPHSYARATAFDVSYIRDEVLPDVEVDALVAQPLKKSTTAICLVVPDADESPGQLFGIEPGLSAERQSARLLAESGCVVVVPFLISRDCEFSLTGAGSKKTNLPHREYIYRQAFEVGRHILGFEVQKLIGFLDAIENGSARSSNAEKTATPVVAIIGNGEGGLLALITGALDSRVSVVGVSGYFGPREKLWQEPIYRNTWRWLDEFGDAELASLIWPRGLVVDPSNVPKVDGPPTPPQAALIAAPGRLESPSFDNIQREFNQARSLVGKRQADRRFQLLYPSDQKQSPNESHWLNIIWNEIAPGVNVRNSETPPTLLDERIDPSTLQERHVQQLVDFTQRLVRESPKRRAELWKDADRKSRDPEKFAETTKQLRTQFYDEVLGRWEMQPLPANPRTRQIYDEPKYTGYEVVLDVFPNVFAYGILLVPKDIKPGEKRPVVVCQHGLEGRPQDLTDPGSDHRAYHRYAGQLAEMGFITYSPQNPYIGKDRFREIVRKANPLGKSLWSFIVPQHQQTVDWLATLPMVDPERIAFYGLSYGGKTAMRVPAVVERYCLSICSGDFNEWIWKNTSVDWPRSYMATGEYEMYEWNLGNTFNYAEMAWLIAPRPFMVERGHRDGVAPDEWVAYEYAKVRLLYADLQIPDRTEIEFFDGPHTINGKGTFAFLRKHLKFGVAER